MKTKKVIYVVVSVMIVLAAAGGAYFFLNYREGKNSKPTPASTSDMPDSIYGDKIVAEQMKKGRDAQDKGDSGKALEHYEAAAKLCGEKDESCNINTSIKVNEMKMAQKAEAKRNTKESTENNKK